MKESKARSKVLRWFSTRLPKIRIIVQATDRVDHQERPSAPLEKLEEGTPASVDNAAPGSSTSRSAKVLSDAQTILPIAQAIGEAIPVAGGFIKAIANGLLHVLQKMNQYDKTKEDIKGLMKKLEQAVLDVDTYPCIRTPAQKEYQETFVSDLEKLLCRIEDRKKQLSLRDLVSDWLVHEIDGYAKEMDISLTRYLVRCQGEGTVHLNSKLDEVLTSVRQVVKNQNAIFKRLDVFSPKPSPGIISFPCVAVMDAMGSEHRIPLDFCFSYEALLMSIQLRLSSPDYPTAYSKFLMKCIKAGRFDLCIETGAGVKELTSEDSGWEAGTTIVMRVVFEEPAHPEPSHSCRSCGNEIPLGSQIGGPAECQGCQARHQVSQVILDGVWCGRAGIDDGSDRISARVCNYRLLQVVQTPLRDALMLCQWSATSSGRCEAPVTYESVSSHLASEHGLEGVNSHAKVICLWQNCGRTMRRISLLRHVCEFHFRLKRVHTRKARFEY